MRRAWAVQTILTVLLASIASPFLHIHPGARHEHSGLPAHEHKTVIHAHVPEAPISAREDQNEPEIADLSHAGHDAQPLSIKALQARAVFSFAPALRAERTVFPTSSPILVAIVPQDVPSAHDPPHLDLTIPRAPPA